MLALNQEDKDISCFQSGGILEINLKAIAENYCFLKKQLKPNVECAAVVKADAYGLGAKQVVPALVEAGCSYFFVATIEEALEFKDYLPSHFDFTQISVAVLDGLIPYLDQEIPDYIIPVLNHMEAIGRWQSISKEKGKILPAILHIDTGMNRLGLSLTEVNEIAKSPNLLDGLDVKFIMSHMACSDEQEHEMNYKQLEIFQKDLEKIPVKALSSFANSSAIFLGEDFHFDMVRAGVSLYGVNPTPGQDNPMKVVVKLKGCVLQVRDVDNEGVVGYGATCKVSKSSRLITVAIGYADGYMRGLSNKGHIFIEGQKAPVVGRVSMDSIIVDITELSDIDVGVGDLIEILGEHQSVDQLAAEAGTIGYEVLTSLGHRFQRRYINNL